jgi:hypothetical protein
MMFDNLNASNFNYSHYFYNAEFEEILSKIVCCYHLMLDDKVQLTNNENAIRDVLLLQYLKNNNVRKKVGLINYLFDREVPEDRGVGRTDIKIQTSNTFIDTNAYYLIECKRLDTINVNGTTGLNAKYIENGICRFTTETYSTHYKTNGMIGFVVQPLDIATNITSINQLLQNSYSTANTTKMLSNRVLRTDFNHCYYSAHNKVVIYHLMLDFSKNIAA